MKRAWLVFGLFIVSLFAVMPGVANAKTPTGLQVRPLRAYPTQKPGSVTSGSLTLTNYTATPIDVAMSAQTFQTTNSDYDYSFTNSGAADWIRFDQVEVNLLPKQSKVVSYQAAVPANASPGGYFISLISSVIPSASNGSVIEVKRVASLVYLEVEGKLVKSGKLVNASAPWFSLSRSIPVEVNVANTGNSYYLARLQFDSSRWPGKQQLYSLQQQSIILPGTVRKLQNTTKLAFLPGIYHVKVNYATPQGSPTNQTLTVVYLPIWAILILVLILLGLAGELAWRYERIPKDSK